jgi:enediyne biosynthesis protein E7
VTTANALTWTWYLLARHPEAAEAVHREAVRAFGGDAPPTVAAAVDDGLAYTGAVVHEVLRLFPPTWRLARTAVAADAIGGHRIPAGAIIVLSPYLLHRHPAYWDEPEAFAPERFLRAGGAPPPTRPRFAYLPFGAGPRACIGSQLALLELRLVVAMVARQFRLTLVPGHPVTVEPLSTLRPRHGLRMRLEERR